MKHTYSFTYECYSGDDVVGSAEVRVEYMYSPYRPAVMYLRNGDPGYPAEGPEIGVIDILIEDWPGPIWRSATQYEFELFSDFATDKHFDDMVEEAEEDERAAKEDAAEHAAEVRSDLRRLDDV